MNLTRRNLLAVGASSGLAAVVAGCSPASSTTTASTSISAAAAPASGAVTGTVRVHIGGDTNVSDLWKNTIQPAFTAKYPGTSLAITQDLHSQQSSQVLAKLAASGSKDPGMDFIDDGMVLGAAKAHLLTEVNVTNVPNLANVPADNATVGLGQAFPYRASAVLLAYDPAKVTTVPNTLNDVLAWITANPGRFAYNSPSTGGSGQAFVVSVLDLFVDPAVRKQMTTTYNASQESQWDKGFAKLKDLGASMYGKGVYPNGNDQVLHLLASGQIFMAPVWSDQFISGQESGTIPASIKAKQIASPSFTGGASYLGIPRNGKNIAGALALADLILSTDIQTRISQKMAGFPAISLSKLAADVQAKFKDADPSHLRQGYQSDFNNDINTKWSQLVPTSR